MSNILLITQEYPADDIAKEFTPVVHFFTKEWVKMGHNVKVVNCPSNFPSIYYSICRPFRKQIESRLGINIRMYTISHREYVLDDVHVLRYPLRKFKPHGRFAKTEIRRAVDYTHQFCIKDSFKPDVILGHWVNPALEMMLQLKQIYNVPIGLVMHDGGIDFHSIYKNEIEIIMNSVDIWGYRSDAIRRQFERDFGSKARWFYCYSGVPEEYICNKPSVAKKDMSSIRNISFVGLLIKRKHPNALVEAVYQSDIINVKVSIIGNGDESKTISQTVQNSNNGNVSVELVGRVPRDKVQEYLQKSEIFVMISEMEAFGLVYLEAMAAGCITIASRNEGMDGIIQDGVNGFLCEAGNVKELTSILNRVNQMSESDRKQLSENAILTAIKLTDKNVAKQYIDDVINLIS